MNANAASDSTKEMKYLSLFASFAAFMLRQSIDSAALSARTRGGVSAFPALRTTSYFFRDTSVFSKAGRKGSYFEPGLHSTQPS